MRRKNKQQQTTKRTQRNEAHTHSNQDRRAGFRHCSVFWKSLSWGTVGKKSVERMSRGRLFHVMGHCMRKIFHRKFFSGQRVLKGYRYQKQNRAGEKACISSELQCDVWEQTAASEKNIILYTLYWIFAETGSQWRTGVWSLFLHLTASLWGGGGGVVVYQIPVSHNVFEVNVHGFYSTSSFWVMHFCFVSCFNVCLSVWWLCAVTPNLVKIQNSAESEQVKLHSISLRSN